MRADGDRADGAGVQETTFTFTSKPTWAPNAAFVLRDLITLAAECWTNCEQSREQLAAVAPLFWVGAV